MPARKRGMIDARGNSAGAWETPARPRRHKPGIYVAVQPGPAHRVAARNFWWADLIPEPETFGTQSQSQAGLRFASCSSIPFFPSAFFFFDFPFCILCISISTYLPSFDVADRCCA